MGVISGVISPIALDGTISGQISNESNLYGELSFSVNNVLSGVLSPERIDGTLYGEITGASNLYGELSILTNIEGIIDIPVSTDVPYYYGDYDVTPLAWQETLLETKGLRMYDNVIVREIPYTEVSNPSGGYTVSIG